MDSQYSPRLRLCGCGVYMTDDPLKRHHGGVLPSEIVAGFTPPVDLSTCVDAFGLFEPVQRALRHVDATAAYRHYPDPQSRVARANLARALGVEAERVDVAPGAAELIWTLVRAGLQRGETALIWKPCFSEFEHAVAAVGGLVAVHEHSGDEMYSELERFAATVRRVRPKMAYLCAPSCPRGEWVPAAGLRQLVENTSDTLFVIDQSYLNLSHHAHELETPFPGNAALVRSVTKELGLPGVRVGYALLTPSLREHLQAHRPCWVLGAHAQAVLEVYGECRALLEARRELLLRQSRVLGDALSLLGLGVALRDTHYFTVSVDRMAPRQDGATGGAVLARTLFDAGVAVRDCTSFGLPDCVRIVAHPEQQKLIDEWSRLVNQTSLGGHS